MNWRIIGTLASKDLSLFFRKKGILALTILGLVFYLIIYFVMPGTVNENLEIGVYAPGLPPVLQHLPEEGLEISIVDSEDVLKERVSDGTYIVGMSLPSDFIEKLNSGQKPDAGQRIRLHAYRSSLDGGSIRGDTGAGFTRYADTTA